MEILDLQERYLEFLDDMQDKSLIDGISGGLDISLPGVVISGTAGTFIAAQFGKTNTILSGNVSSFGSLDGSPNDFKLNIGTLVDVMKTPSPTETPSP